MTGIRLEWWKVYLCTCTSNPATHFCLTVALCPVWCHWPTSLNVFSVGMLAGDSNFSFQKREKGKEKESRRKTKIFPVTSPFEDMLVYVVFCLPSAFRRVRPAGFQLSVVEGVCCVSWPDPFPLGSLRALPCQFFPAGVCTCELSLQGWFPVFCFAVEGNTFIWFWIPRILDLWLDAFYFWY